MLGVAAAIPLLACGWIWWHRRPAGDQWKRVHLPRVAALFLAGAVAAGPFFTSREVGTGEAYNYSLATADAVTQFRAGVFPVLVGQSEYAWNGRVHPLRTAPYLAYFAGLLDALTFHRFGFWALQNLALAMSLIGGAFSAYWCLRRGADAPPGLAVVLAAGYVLAPGVLAPAYAMDLYMTVMTVPFIPVLLMALSRAWRGDGSFANLAWLAASLAAAWTAHPPVALWLTTVAFVLLLPLMVRGRFGGGAGTRMAAAMGLAVALGAYAFVSALSVKTFPNFAIPANVDTLLQETRRVWRAALRPVSLTADQLGDFQLGYAYWGLLVGAVGAALASVRTSRDQEFRGRRAAGIALLAAAATLLAVTLPVPVVQAWFWRRAPSIYMELTNQWPMQRLYLMITPLALFAFALLCPRPLRLARWARDPAYCGLAAAVLWTGWQAWRFVARGYASQRSAAVSADSHRPENLDLTAMSYAILAPPASFINGVMDPLMECRLIRRITHDELLSNWDAAVDEKQIVQGTFQEATAAGDTLFLKPTLHLAPGFRYRLRFAFPREPWNCTLQMRGPGLDRDYHLPSAGGPRGFGMMPGNNPALTLWTSEAAPIDVQLSLFGQDWGARSRTDIAGFTLDRLDPARLPIRVESLLPFRATVRAPEACLLETPRLFLDGYVASVDGRPVRVLVSPQKLAMIPVPAGTSRVELRYPGPLSLRLAFWLSFFSWLGLGAVGVTRAVNPAWRFPRPAIPRIPWRGWCWGAGGALVAAAGVVGFVHWRAYREACGPIRIRMLLSEVQLGRNQPVLTTGRPGAGTFVFLNFPDATHVRVGMDVWGRLLVLTNPIAVDYEEVQEMVISTGALYPENHPKLHGLSEARLRELRRHVAIQLNGMTVINREIGTYPSTPSEVTVGESRIGGSNTEAHFAGKILSVERLPVPAN